MILKSCSPDEEQMIVKCRPFYLPRELTAIIIIAVYAPPSADVKQAMGELYNTVRQLQTSNPDAICIIAGDFNKANLNSALPNFHQHVACATRGENTLDHLYTNIKKAYTAAHLSHIGSSDHLTVPLGPVYRPINEMRAIHSKANQSVATGMPFYLSKVALNPCSGASLRMLQRLVTVLT